METKQEIQRIYNKDRIILDVLDALVELQIGEKSQDVFESGDREYVFQCKENFTDISNFVRKLQRQYDFSIKTFTDEDDHTHNISIYFMANTIDILDGR